MRRELYGYLDCGILANGFARVHCASCGRDELVAFSCKGRGFCPSCGGRRMAETAMHLADEALPAVPLRQGALFPLLRALHLAYDAELCAAVRRIFVRALLAWHGARAERAAVAAGRSGAVVVAQRFGSALNLNLHFHALLLDGVYASPERRTRWVPAFGRRDDAYDDDLVCASKLAPELMGIASCASPRVPAWRAPGCFGPLRAVGRRPQAPFPPDFSVWVVFGRRFESDS